jgi:hypothetical protein
MRKLLIILLVINCAPLLAQQIGLKRCFIDRDGDGQGDPKVYIAASPIFGCELLGNEMFKWVPNDLDCDDGNFERRAELHYWDGDGDGYVLPNAPTSVFCSFGGVFVYGFYGFSLINRGQWVADFHVRGFNDCNDHDYYENPDAVWILDPDGDRYFDSLSWVNRVFQCTRPPGLYYQWFTFKTGGGWDCNSNDSTEHPGQKWYLDVDGDGFPGNTPVKTQCNRPGGNYFVASELISLGLDCNDSNASIKPITTWYGDGDDDGYSSGSTLISCERPVNYKLPFELIAIGDCDDNDPAVWRTMSIWIDNDHDGRRGSMQSVDVCTGASDPPNKWNPSLDPSSFLIDCNDDDSSRWRSVTLYYDSDSDGYHSGILQICYGSDYDIPENYYETTLGLDCDDNAEETGDGRMWVKDADEDGYYPGSPIIQCASPGPGYILLIHNGNANDIGLQLTELYNKLPGDCDDTKPDIKPSNKWVKDADGDGYYPGDPVQQCSSPGAGYILLTFAPIISGLQFTLSFNKYPGDCDDNIAAINPASKWVVDADGDGYYPGNPLQQCTSPGTGYVVLTFDTVVSGNALIGLVITLLPKNKFPGDCNDNNILLHPATKWYKDADDDHYSDSTIKTQCVRPAGYKLLSELTSASIDCDDNNDFFNPGTVWYKDADNDGFSDGTPKTQCVRPTGYKLISELSTSLFGSFGDCDDNNPAINPRTVWYQDFDNDGYSNGFSAMTCGRATGWKLPSELTATNGDCNDNNANINPATKWYKDADNDGYSDGTTQTQCAKPAGYKLPSELTATNGDCNDNNAVLNPATIWYKDTDNDGYSNGTTQIQCTRPTNYKLESEITAKSGDCNDTDPTVNPASAEVCNNNKDDNCNGLQNEAGCYTCSNATSFSTTNVTSNSATLNWESIPHPDYWQVRYKGKGVKWTDVTPDPGGDQRSVTINGLIPNDKYHWQIKARCGNNWTNYSVSVSFTTAGGVTARSEATTNAEMETSEVAIVSLQVKATPNPSNTSFRIALNSNNLKEPVKLIITDMLGRVIETRTTNAGQIIIGERYRSGTYLVRIIQGKETRQLKLIKLPD